MSGDDAFERHEVSEEIKDAVKAWEDAGGEILAQVDASRWTIVSVGEGSEPADGYDRIVCGKPVTRERLHRLIGNLPSDDEDEV